MGARSSDPVVAFQFRMEIQFDPFHPSLPVPITGYFSEVSGLDVELEKAEYKTTNMLGLPATNMVPMRPVYHPITLRRGVTDSAGLWYWHNFCTLGLKAILKQNVVITLFDRAYEPVAEWSIEQAWPSKISGPRVAADSNDIAIEEITLTHGGILRTSTEPLLMAFDLLAQAFLP